MFTLLLLIRHENKLEMLAIPIFKRENVHMITFISSDLNTINDLVGAANLVLKEVLRILKRETEMHTAVQESHLGWRAAAELDKEELDDKEKESAKLL